MVEWKPIMVLPNLDMRAKLECPYAAIVSPIDYRVEKLCADHPILLTFLSKFTGQLGQQIRPSLLLMRIGTPNSYYSTEAIAAFRDILSLSVVLYARARRLRSNQGNSLVFTNTFQFYPWMIDKGEIILVNAAQTHIDVLDKFKGQSFPEQAQVSVAAHDIDLPLARELLKRWMIRFSGNPIQWKDKALFRSLNMANEAGRIPALAAESFYDVGRSLAHWVSAYEILAHPGGTGHSGFATVSAILENVKWLNAKLSVATHIVPGKPARQTPLATWLCKKVYDLRNDFLHGNEVRNPRLTLNGSQIGDFAACLYRLALASLIDLELVPLKGPITRLLSPGVKVCRFQSDYEDGLLKAISTER